MAGSRRAARLELPAGSSDLTADPNEDLWALPWVQLCVERTACPGPAGFWHTMAAWTRTHHWNRTIWKVEVLDEFAAGGEEVVWDGRKDGHRGQLKRGGGAESGRYMALRRLSRKTPAPVGGGADGKGESMDALEWTVHCVREGVHTAVFGLVVPEGAREEGNMRAMRYWPFQYPKVKCYRVTYEKDSSGTGGFLKYSVVPLAEDVDDSRDYEATKAHAEKAASKILKSVRKWSERYDPKAGKTSYQKRVVHDRLVSERDYRRWYNLLKTKYRNWVQKWPESSNEVKYVFEEMAIAAYLLALWEQERKEMGVDDGNFRQSFVDLGCGNGFLVYLLVSEGHRGKGIDLQKRVLWDEYPDEIREVLRKEELVDATYDASEFDWIIGNHPDELTPWIPAIAGISQKIDLSKGKVPIKVGQWTRPRFLVLPCCFDDFDGHTYAFGTTRRLIKVEDTGQGKYAMYLEYIEKIAEAMGFDVERENLRIPSTKYVALIGRKMKNLQAMDHEQLTNTLNTLINDTTNNR